MTDSRPDTAALFLPSAASLEQLKKQAKDLKKAAGVPLAEAQRDLARRYGFASWPRLKKHVEALHWALDDKIARFIKATVVADGDHRSGDTRHSAALLAEEPRIATASIYSAVMLGEPDAVRDLLAADPDLARRRGGSRNWEPLLYLCFSRFLRTDPGRAATMVEAAALLLEAGADPNAHWVDSDEATDARETCVYGAAGIANNQPLTQLLLEAGADPNDGETAYHSVEHDGVPCLDLLWEHFDEDSRSIAIQHKVDYADAPGLKKLLGLGADANTRRFFDRSPLHGATFRDHDEEIFELLFEFGADPDVTDRSGRTPYARAARAGNERVMEILVRHGAHRDLSPVDSFLAACAVGNGDGVAAALASDPNLVSGLADDERAVICETASAGNALGVRTMLDAGIDIDTRDGIWKATPIQRAAMMGHQGTVTLLYERGADLTIRDVTYDSSPIGWAEHGGHDQIVTYLKRDPSRLDLRDAVQAGFADRVGELLADTPPDTAFGTAEPGALLRAAAYGGHGELVATLIALGADPRREDSVGLTARDYASQQGHGEIVDLLGNDPEDCHEH